MGMLGLGATIGQAAVGANYFGSGVDGSLSTSGNVSLSSTQDGDMVVKHYQNLTINAGHTVTVANRCRGLLLYVDGDLTVAGTLTMTARGASADPAALGVPSAGLQIWRALPAGSSGNAGQVLNGLSGCGSAALSAEGNQPFTVGAPSKVWSIQRTGAAGGTGNFGSYGNPGANGGVGQSGGGGSGGGAAGDPGTGGLGGTGTCFSGGPGAGTGDGGTGGNGSNTGGAGGNGQGPNNQGGVGNPGGTGNQVASANGTGGLLILIVRGNVTVQSGGVISADGVANIAGGARSGGSSGGGNILLLHGGTYTNSGSVRCAGGASVGGGGGASGAGGAGSVQTGQILNVKPAVVVTPPVTGVSTAYAYWRLRATDASWSGGNNWAVSEIGFWTGADGTGTNLAAGSTPIGRQYSSAITIDGNLSTSIGNSDSVKTWWGIQLAAPAAISSCSFNGEASNSQAYPKSFVLEGSSDGTNWTTIQGYYTPTYKTGFAPQYTFNVTPNVGYRYWKIRPTDAMWAGGNDWRTLGLALYLSADCTGTNIALASLGSIAMGPSTAAGLTALNDSEMTSGSFASSGINGDPGFGGGYFMIDLGAGRKAYPKSLAFSTVWAGAGGAGLYPKQFAVEMSQDLVNWPTNFGIYATPSGLAEYAIFQLFNIPTPNGAFE